MREDVVDVSRRQVLVKKRLLERGKFRCREVGLAFPVNCGIVGRKEIVNLAHRQIADSGRHLVNTAAAADNGAVHHARVIHRAAEQVRYSIGRVHLVQTIEEVNPPGDVLVLVLLDPPVKVVT